MVERQLKINSIVVLGRRWFDKVNGNTYFSSVVYANGNEQPEIYIDFEYGYDEQYLYSAINAFAKGHPELKEGFKDGFSKRNRTLNL